MLSVTPVHLPSGTMPRSGSTGTLPNSYARIHVPYEMEKSGRVHLISLDLWEAITGEKASVDALTHLLDQADVRRSQSAHQPPPEAQQYLVMSRDQQKSRLLQQIIQDSTPSQRTQIFLSLQPYLRDLIVDQSANFVIQKLCEFATEEQHIILRDFFLEDLEQIVEHQIACRVLQKFIESTDPSNIEPIFQQLKPQLIHLCTSPNGNHIVQRFVTSLPHHLEEIMTTILPHVVQLAIHNCGCRIVQRLFDQFSISEIVPIVDEVLKNAVDLATNQYGNYVVQNILTGKETDYISSLTASFTGKFYKFSMHKYASNVIEKCIKSATDDEREKIFAEIIGNDGAFEYDRILKMIVDQFGNFVIQRIIEFGNQKQIYAVLKVVSENKSELMRKQYAKYVMTKLDAMGFSF